MPTMYELTAQVIEAMESGEEEFLAEMEHLMPSMESKVDGYGRVMADLTSHAKSCREEAARLTEKARISEVKAERLVAHLSSCMDAMGFAEIKGDVFVAKFKKNPPKIEVEDSAQIPEVFFLPQPPKLDMAALKEALKLGSIPGARLTQAQRLEVK